MRHTDYPLGKNFLINEIDVYGVTGWWNFFFSSLQFTTAHTDGCRRLKVSWKVRFEWKTLIKPGFFWSSVAIRLFLVNGSQSRKFSFWLYCLGMREHVCPERIYRILWMDACATPIRSRLVGSLSYGKAYCSFWSILGFSSELQPSQKTVWSVMLKLIRWTTFR